MQLEASAHLEQPYVLWKRIIAHSELKVYEWSETANTTCLMRRSLLRLKSFYFGKILTFGKISSNTVFSVVNTSRQIPAQWTDFNPDR